MTERTAKRSRVCHSFMRIACAVIALCFTAGCATVQFYDASKGTLGKDIARLKPAVTNPRSLPVEVALADPGSFLVMEKHSGSFGMNESNLKNHSDLRSAMALVVTLQISQPETESSYMSFSWPYLRGLKRIPSEFQSSVNAFKGTYPAVGMRSTGFREVPSANGPSLPGAFVMIRTGSTNPTDIAVRGSGTIELVWFIPFTTEPIEVVFEKSMVPNLPSGSVFINLRESP